MELVKEGAELFIPDGKLVDIAIARTTHMAISAHQDDIEIMACDGILQCFGKDEKWFMGVVVTNGAGSPRTGIYEKYTDKEMQEIRKKEQKKSAYIGEYGSMALLDYASAEVKDSENTIVINEIKKLITAARPEVVYTHNLADKHDTHVAVVLRVISAIRNMPYQQRPKKLYGCEVWRSLDWMNDNEKVLFNVSQHSNIAEAVLGVHDSQICGGKRYDYATKGRRRANATYSESHGTDNFDAVSFGMDLTPLIKDDSLDVTTYIQGFIERFKYDVVNRVSKIL